MEDGLNTRRQEEMSGGDKIQTIKVVKMRGSAHYYKVCADMKYAKTIREKLELINIDHLIFKITPVSSFFCNIKYD